MRFVFCIAMASLCGAKASKSHEDIIFSGGLFLKEPALIKIKCLVDEWYSNNLRSFHIALLCLCI